MGMFIPRQLSRLGPSRNLNGHVLTHANYPDQDHQGIKMGMFFSCHLSRLGPSRNLNGHVYLTPTFLIRTVKES